MAKDWQQATVLQYASSSHPWKALGRSGKVRMDLRKRRERVRCGAMVILGWSDSAYGGQSTEEKRQLGCVIGLMSSTLKGPCHILRGNSEFTMKMAKSSLGGEVYALREMVDHMLLTKDSFLARWDWRPA